MGLIKLLFHSKEICELEDVLKLLLDKLKNINNNTRKEYYREHPNNLLIFRNSYGYGTIVKPRTDISFAGDIWGTISEYKSKRYYEDKIIIIKKDDYNRFNEMSIEFSHKANRYMQLLKKTETSISVSMRDIITIYEGIVIGFNYSYKYVVE